MGCDIHAYIEHYSKKDLLAGKCFVDTSSGAINFGRDYLLFGVIAGVRSLETPVVSPRGLPTNPPLGWECSNEYYMRVVSDEEYQTAQRDLLGQKLVSKSELEKINSAGYLNKIIPDSQNMIPSPYFHNLTWLTLSEMLLVRKKYLLEYIQFYDEMSGLSSKKKKELITFIDSKDEKTLMKYTFHPYESLSLYTTICSMMAMERVNDDIATRFVCWFDS